MPENSPNPSARPGRRTKRLLVALFCGLLVIYGGAHAFLSFNAPPDPIVQGERLSDLLLAANGFAPVRNLGVPPLALGRQLKGVQGIDTVAPESMVPLLVSWVKTPPSEVRARLAALLRKAGRPSLRLEADVQMAALRQIFRQPIPSEDLAWALVEALTNTTSPNILNNDAAYALRSVLRTNVKLDRQRLLRLLAPLEPLYRTSSRNHQGLWQLQQCIVLCEPDSTLRALAQLDTPYEEARIAATRFLSDRPRHPDQVIPTLTANLSSANPILAQVSIQALLSYGTNARPAMPEISRLLNHPNLPVRRSASNALEQLRSIP